MFICTMEVVNNLVHYAIKRTKTQEIDATKRTSQVDGLPKNTMWVITNERKVLLASFSTYCTFATNTSYTHAC